MAKTIEKYISGNNDHWLELWTSDLSFAVSIMLDIEHWELQNEVISVKNHQQ